MKTQQPHIVLSRILLQLVVFCITTGCSFYGKSTPQAFTIATYNVQTFFDAVTTGTEYSEFTTSEWTTEKYGARIERLCSTISEITKGGPDILILHEIENEYVLQDIRNNIYGIQKYPYAAFVHAPGQSITSGILSRFSLSKVAALQTNGGNAPAAAGVDGRPMIEAHFSINGHKFVIFTCHWKSKKGGGSELRCMQSAAVAGRVTQLQKMDPNLHIMIAGDMNEGHLENNVLRQYFPGAKTRTQIHITGNKHDTAQNGVFYEPWFTLAGSNSESAQNLECGSYVYKNKWETIDHLLFNAPFFDGSGAEFSSCTVAKLPQITDSVTGAPYRYQVYTGKGYSDHFPLVAVITIAE